MKVDITSEVVIARPLDVVAAFAGDPSNASAWYVNIDSIVWATEPPPRAGSRVRFVARFLGPRRECTYELDAHDVAEQRGEPRGFSTLVVPFMAMAVRRANRNDLAELKRILERSAGGR